MNAVLSIELEVLDPEAIGDGSRLRELHQHQIRWASLRLISEGETSACFSLGSDDVRLGFRDLIDVARLAQPEGTSVLVWYQGRSERFQI